MKVLVCIPCLLTGGTEIQTLSLVEALVAAGHRVSVVCYFEYADAMVKRYTLAGAEVILLQDDGVGSETHASDKKGSRPEGLGRTVRALWRGLRRTVRTVRPDVAHVQYMAPGAIPIVMLRLLGVPKVVATAHTAADIYSPRGLRLVQALNRRLLDAFQCITLRAERSFFGEGALLSEQTRLGRRGAHFTVYNNVPSYIEAASPRTGATCGTGAPGAGHSQTLILRTVGTSEEATTEAKGTLTVGVVSRLEGIKGMDLVVPAFAQVLRCVGSETHASEKTHASVGFGPELRLVVVGDGSQRELMERQAREAGIADRVEFAGRQPQDALQAFYDRIDILLMPSRSEGFGLTAVEGMARGCVPLVADTGGLPEVVRDGVDGLLHAPESVESLAKQLRRLVEDEGLRRGLREGALRRAQDFSREAYGQQIALLYRKLEEI